MAHTQKLYICENDAFEIEFNIVYSVADSQIDIEFTVTCTKVSIKLIKLRIIIILNKSLTKHCNSHRMKIETLKRQKEN